MNDDLATRPCLPGVDAILLDMARRWENGVEASATDYLAAHPELASQPEAMLRLIYEEFCLREEHGEAVNAEDWLARFPRWRKELAALLECHHLMEATVLHSPDVVGHPDLKGYKVVAELGRGSQGSVLLARQDALDDRPVVLKISPHHGVEHLTLARLQHTGIVPLYSVEENVAENARILCMPYFGGATLKQILVQMDRPVGRRQGSDILAALDRLQSASPIPVAGRGPAREFLANASYAHAVSWIGLCLAEALQFAHERGCIHLDIKPANILLTADGQPMLLDFHIAQRPLARGMPAPCGFGGTPAYMSPEQKAATRAGDLQQPVADNIDGRSDVYSLGLVLAEALGRAPASEAPNASDLAALPIPHGLRDILARCLAVKAADRYENAAALAEDLRRHLQDLPLKGVRNRSLMERWQKWHRRRPAALPLSLMIAAVLLAALSLGLFFWQQSRERVRQAEQALSDGKEQFQQRRFLDATSTLQHAIQLAEQSGNAQLRDAAQAELDKARRAHVADKLHALAEVFRYHGADPNLRGNVSQLQPRWRSVWDQRAWLLTPAGEGLSAKERERLRADLLDLALVWADLQVRLADADGKRQARRDALSLLKEADAELGPSPVLRLQRRDLEAALGERTAPAAANDRVELWPKTAWECYAWGRIVLQQGNLEKADEMFRRAVDLDPGGFWPIFYLGLCAMQRHDYPEAESAFRVCVSLAPESAVSHFNRGLALARLGRDGQAIAAFGRALHHDAKLGPAAFHRGVLLFHDKRYADAVVDLERALECGHDAVAVCCQLALAHQALGQHARAVAAARQAHQADPADKTARKLFEQLTGK